MFSKSKEDDIWIDNDELSLYDLIKMTRPIKCHINYSMFAVHIICIKIRA